MADLWLWLLGAGLLFIVAILAVLALVALAPAAAVVLSRRDKVRSGETERLFARAADGNDLCLHHYKPAIRRYREPVILCHGLGANRFNLDLGPGLSLPAYLRDEGFDVYVVELRGTGISPRPVDAEGRFLPVHFDDLAQLDVPAAMAMVKRHSGADRVLWVGHSMGGMVALAYLVMNPNAPVAALAAVGSPTSFPPRPLTPVAGFFAPLLRSHRRLNLSTFMGLTPPVAFLFQPHLRILANGRNFTPAILRRIGANLPCHVPVALLGDFARFVGTGRFTSADGRMDYLDGLKRVTTPTLFMVGTADRQVTEAHMRPGFDRLGSSDKRFVVAGVKGGMSTDYGHGDLILGKDAPLEIFPVLADWLRTHATPIVADMAGAMPVPSPRGEASPPLPRGNEGEPSTVQASSPSPVLGVGLGIFGILLCLVGGSPLAWADTEGTADPSAVAAAGEATDAPSSDDTTHAPPQRELRPVFGPGTVAADDGDLAGRRSAPRSPGEAPAFPADPPTPQAAQARAELPFGGFRFGSYGRVNVSDDLNGHPGRALNVVEHGSRLEESPYLELYFYKDFLVDDGLRMGTVITLSFFPPFFHYSGTDAGRFAIRNAYVSAQDLFVPGLFLWAGSRMYRGDDIYLLDWWPLDNLNTIGAGAGWRGEVGAGQRLEFALHGGANRLQNDWQFQQVDVPGRGFGAERLTVLERQRMILSAKLTHEWYSLAATPGGELGLKYKLYGEFHRLPSGEIEVDGASGSRQTMPEDFGFMVGAQLGLWGFGPSSFVNVFASYADGLAAYGELAVPWAVDRRRTTRGAMRLNAGFSANFEGEWWGLLAGGYVSWFKDADPNVHSLGKYAEYIVSARPMAWVGRHFHPGIELSWQSRLSAGFSPTTGNQERPGVFKFSIIPAISLDKGSYRRPQIRFVYTLAWLNRGARDLYPVGDARRAKSLQHYLGVGVEWWFDAVY